MHDEVVRRRRWLSDAEFLDLVGATNLIPGPNSTELAIHLGYRRAGAWGLVLAGASFIVPAFLTVLACAWAYVRYGALPEVQAALYGAKPAILAVVVHALWRLGRTALKDAATVVAATAAVALAFAGVHELLLLAAGGLGLCLVRGLRPPGALWAGAGLAAAGPTAVPFDLATLFFTFLKIGSVLFGSGYVLLAFLRADFVVRLGWLTEAQLLDAVAVGQVTPGPVFTTATFVGYLLGGGVGAVVATVGIFLPAFVFVAATHPLVPRMRRSAVASAFLDGVNAVSLALMAAVTWHLGTASVVDAPTAVLAAVALAVVAQGHVNSAVVLVACAGVGLLVRALAP
jgi:chromate transporter